MLKRIKLLRFFWYSMMVTVQLHMVFKGNMNYYYSVIGLYNGFHFQNIMQSTLFTNVLLLYSIQSYANISEKGTQKRGSEVWK